MREPFSVHTPADRPYGVLFALATASSGVRNVSTDSTGTEDLLAGDAMACATLEKTVGAKKNPLSGSVHGAGPAHRALGFAGRRQVA